MLSVNKICMGLQHWNSPSSGILPQGPISRLCSSWWFCSSIVWL